MKKTIFSLFLIEKDYKTPLTDRIFLKFQKFFLNKSVRVFTALLRYLYFSIFRNKKKLGGNKDFIGKEVEKGKDSLEYNFEKIKKSIFVHDRMLNLIRPTLSVESVLREKQSQKILSIGPRSESELLLLAAHGFLWRNISALDLFSYTPKITVGDMHKMPFNDNTFDIIFSGWVLAYSDSLKLAMKEKVRVLKNNGIIAFGHGYKLEGQKEKRIPNEIDEIIKPIKKNVRTIFFKHDIDNQMRKKGQRMVVAVLSIKK